jgi:hypothetical protein
MLCFPFLIIRMKASIPLKAPLLLVSRPIIYRIKNLQLNATLIQTTTDTKKEKKGFRATFYETIIRLGATCIWPCRLLPLNSKKENILSKVRLWGVCTERKFIVNIIKVHDEHPSSTDVAVLFVFTRLQVFSVIASYRSIQSNITVLYRAQLRPSVKDILII